MNERIASTMWTLNRDCYHNHLTQYIATTLPHHSRFRHHPIFDQFSTSS